MESVTHRCAECSKSPDETKFRTTNTTQGERFRKYCEPCSALRTKRLNNAPSSPVSTALVPSRIERATVNGCELQAVFVNEFQRYWPVKSAVEAAGIDWSAQLQRIKRDARLARSMCEITIETPAGPRQAVCLPWEAWHYFWVGVTDAVNDVARPAIERIKDEAYSALAMVFGDGPKAIAAPTIGSIDPDLLIQVGEGLVAIFQTVVDNAVTNRMGPMPQQTADNWETLQGVTVIEREVKTEVRIDLDFDGYNYVFVNDETAQMSIGETYKTPQDRINNGDYNGSKDGRRPWREVFAAKIDQRKKGQTLLQKYAVGMGVRRIRGDIYTKDDQFIADICQLPRKLRLNDIQSYVERGKLFAPPMFR